MATMIRQFYIVSQGLNYVIKEKHSDLTAHVR